MANYFDKRVTHIHCTISIAQLFCTISRAQLLLHNIFFTISTAQLPLSFLCVSYGVLCVLLRFSYVCPMIFIWCAYDLPMSFLWYSNDFQRGFPMIFLWFSFDFPQRNAWFPYDFPMIFLCHSQIVISLASLQRNPFIRTFETWLYEQVLKNMDPDIIWHKNIYLGCSWYRIWHSWESFVINWIFRG